MQDSPLDGSPLLAISDLHAGYGETEVLRGVDLSVDAREIVAVLGSNGAGKSTLNRVISGVLRARKGSIRFAGDTIDQEIPASIVSRGLIHVPEGRRVFPRMTVLENLEMGAFARGKADPHDLARVFDLFPRLKERTA